jgi:hypothetical protein
MGVSEQPVDAVGTDRFAGVWHTGILVAAAVLPAALFLAFAIHYWSNAPDADDWSAVAIVSTAMTGHIPWHLMWAQHLDNRTFVPNAGFVIVGAISHESMAAQILVNDLIFICAFGIFLSLFRHYVPAAFRPIPVLSLGLIWFSLADLSSAVWAFQLTWYLIVLMLMTVLWLFLTRSMTWTVLVLAILCAVAASYSSTQGLILWPVGLVGILWTQPWRPNLWARSARWMSATWVGAAIVTMAIYLIGYQSVAPNPWNLFPAQLLGVNFSSTSPSYVVNHPVASAKFFLVLTGNVISLGPLWLRGGVGAVLLIASIYVIVRSGQRRHSGITTYLPVALIAFGLVVDVLTVFGRTRYGLSYSLSSRYTMFNLVLLIGIGVFVLDYLYTTDRSRARIAAAAIVLLVIAQVAMSTVGGVPKVAVEQKSLHMEGRLVTTTDLVPPSERLCYHVNALFRFQVPSLTGADVELLRRQQLTIFGPGPYREYRSEGLPVIASCDKAAHITAS